MENTSLQFGSGGAALGNLDALKSEMMGAGIDPSVLNRVGSNAPTARPNMAPAQLPQAQAPQPQATPAPNTPAPTGLPINDPEASLILKAMSARLGSLSKRGQ